MSKRKSARGEWEIKFMEKVNMVHKRNKDKVVGRIMKRADGLRGSMVTRSKKHDAECGVTLTDLREMLFDAYGTPCRYCGKLLTIQNLVVDHIVPLSKGGTSNRDNLQVICKTSNNLKGSLTEEHFQILLDWLDSIPEELSKDVRIRLAKGIS